MTISTIFEFSFLFYIILILLHWVRGEIYYYFDRTIPIISRIDQQKVIKCFGLLYIFERQFKFFSSDRKRYFQAKTVSEIKFQETTLHTCIISFLNISSENCPKISIIYEKFLENSEKPFTIHRSKRHHCIMKKPAIPQPIPKEHSRFPHNTIQSVNQ